jgi:hypothetical protein
MKLEPSSLAKRAPKPKLSDGPGALVKVAPLALMMFAPPLPVTMEPRFVIAPC